MQADVVSTCQIRAEQISRPITLRTRGHSLGPVTGLAGGAR
jgi:hypothetical protein